MTDIIISEIECCECLWKKSANVNETENKDRTERCGIEEAVVNGSLDPYALCFIIFDPRVVLWLAELDLHFNNVFT
jgi:hypothetical protein